jgi:head-tail adaptor
MGAAGPRDRRILLLRAAIRDDGLQRRPDGWQPIGARWARVIIARGSEARAALGTDAQLPATFTIAWSPEVADVGAGDRVRYPASGGQVFDIKAAVEIGRRDEIEIHAVGAASLRDE